MDSEQQRERRRYFRDMLMNELRREYIESVPGQFSNGFVSLGRMVMHRLAAHSQQTEDYLLEAVSQALNGEAEAATASLVHYATAVAGYFADECMAGLEDDEEGNVERDT